jgi:transposase-like protein
MARSYAPEFRRRVVELVRSGRSVCAVAAEIGVSEATVYRWRAQVGSTAVSGQGCRVLSDPTSLQARRKIRGLETEAGDHEEGIRAVRRRRGAPKRKYPVIAFLAGQGYEAKRCCRVLGVGPSGYLSWRRRSPSPAELRREWLRGLINQIHANSRGVYGYRRVRAELNLGWQITVSNRLVHRLMAEERLQGLPSGKQGKSLINVATAEDLVCRDINRDRPNQLWLTDITEHPTREGKVYCRVVLDGTQG